MSHPKKKTGTWTFVKMNKYLLPQHTEVISVGYFVTKVAR